MPDTPQEFTDFERDYFLQTRKEIDTEKQERNKLLNYGLLALGGMCTLVARSDKIEAAMPTPRNLFDWSALWFGFLLLAVVCVLTIARRAKLQQIADRWFVLKGLLAATRVPINWRSLEGVVCHGLEGWRYLVEDFALHLGLCVGPVAILLKAARELKDIWAWSIFAAIVLFSAGIAVWIITPVKNRLNA